MSLLAESNSLKKINMKEKLPLSKLIKRIIYVIVLVLLVGGGIQIMYNFVSGEMIKNKAMYSTIESKKIYFDSQGAGEYTVIFDGQIGTNMNQWDATIDGLENLGVRTFVYNRNGYGLSSGSERLTPEQQAEQLSKLLKKAAITGKYILVGEGYGSLVLTNFAKQNPDKVKGVVLINPINESDKAKYHNFKGFMSLVGKKIQALGANCTLTWILDKFGLATEYPDFEKGLQENEKAATQYSWLKNQAPYRNAIYNESKNLYEMKDNSETKGMFKNMPLYIISNVKDNPLKDLGGEFTTDYYTDYSGHSFSSKNPKDVVSAINKVVDQAVRIDARNKENTN